MAKTTVDRKIKNLLDSLAAPSLASALGMGLGESIPVGAAGRVPISMLRPNPDNIRFASDRTALTASLDLEGVTSPLLIDQSGMILDGNTRYEIVRDLAQRSEADAARFADLPVVVSALSGYEAMLLSDLQAPRSWAEQCVLYAEICRSEDWDQARLAKHVSRTEGMMSKQVRIGGLGREILAALAAKGVGTNDLLRLCDKVGKVGFAWQYATVGSCEAWINKVKDHKKTGPRQPVGAGGDKSGGVQGSGSSAPAVVAVVDRLSILHDAVDMIKTSDNMGMPSVRPLVGLLDSLLSQCAAVSGTEEKMKDRYIDLILLIAAQTYKKK
jgi:hypothetical protein